MANITVTLYWDMDLRKWTTTLGGTTETDPIQGLVQGDIVKFAVRFVQNDLAVVLAAPVFTASGIKADNDFTGSYLIQLSAPVLSDTTLYTFTVNPLNSANLNTFLQTYRNTWCALEIYDSVNGILTTPLELQITPGYSLSGTPTDNVAGVIVVAAGKTVTFPLSLTFPAAAGTNGYHLALLNATTGTTEWVADATGSGTVTTTGAMTADTIVLSNGTTVIKSTTTGAGVVAALGNTPNATGGIVTFSGNIGAATATSLNGITITAGGTGTLTMAGSIDLSGTAAGSLTMSGNIGDAGGSITTNVSGGSINTSDHGGSINTSGDSGLSGGSINTSCISGNFAGGSINTSSDQALGGSINTSEGGGSITTNGNGSIGLGIVANRTYLVSTAGNNEKTATFPNVTGTVALNETISGGTLAGSFTTLAASTFLDIAATAATAGTATAGVIRQAGSRILHTYGTQNLFIGDGSGNFALTGTINTGIGRATLLALISGARNVALGDGVMYLLQSGSDNLAIGRTSLNALVSGGENVGVGTSALFLATGSSSVGIGYQAGYAIGAGSGNVSIGKNSLANSANSFAALSSASNCTALGAAAEVTTAGQTTVSYRTAIGSGATATADNQVMLGRATDMVTLPGGLVTVPVAQTATTAAVSVAVTTTALTTTAPAQAITLANGTDGQIKIIAHVASSGGGTAVLTPATSAADYNIITFTNVGETATLQYHTTGGWYILALRGAVAA
jgi:hypothetical protein